MEAPLPDIPHYLLIDATTGERIAWVPAPPRTTVYEACVRSGVRLATRCRGSAVCGLCRVEVLEGAEELPPRQPDEEVVLGDVLDQEGGERLRLACRIELPNGVHRLVLGVRPEDRVR
ncbi:MAG: (2Fe-2S)-binding protein [Deltaproteobacteria bacterium]|nr:MAG: (2Fe-2S)-binding protein [Deltaproteobacteria bacterium]